DRRNVERRGGNAVTTHPACHGMREVENAGSYGEYRVEAGAARRPIPNDLYGAGRGFGSQECVGAPCFILVHRQGGRTDGGLDRTATLDRLRNPPRDVHV